MSNNSGMGTSARTGLMWETDLMRGFRCPFVGLGGINSGGCAGERLGIPVDWFGAGAGAVSRYLVCVRRFFLQQSGREVYRCPGGQGGRAFPVWRGIQNQCVFPASFLYIWGPPLHLPGVAGDDDCMRALLALLVVGETSWMRCTAGNGSAASLRQFPWPPVISSRKPMYSSHWMAFLESAGAGMDQVGEGYPAVRDLFLLLK